MNIQQYHTRYASVKARGVSDITYIVTVHKKPVLRSGYEFSNVLEQSYFNQECKKYEVSEEKKIERRDKSLQRSKNNIIQYVANNAWDYFVTLTVSPDKIKKYGLDRYDLCGVAKVVTQFFVNYSRRNGSDTDFKYLLIPELHQDGAVHFHGVFKGINKSDLFVNEHGYLDFKPFKERFGFVNVSRGKAKKNEDFCTMGKIKNLEACANYITKYITKDMLNNHSLKSKHLYFCSKGLNKDRVLKIGVPVISADEFVEMGLVSFENEYCCKTQLKDMEMALSFVQSFEKNHKLGINMRSVSLTKQEKRKIKTAIVAKTFNRYDMPLVVNENNVGSLWGCCMQEFFMQNKSRDDHYNYAVPSFFDKYQLVKNDYERLKKIEKEEKAVNQLIAEIALCLFLKEKTKIFKKVEYTQLAFDLCVGGGG